MKESERKALLDLGAMCIFMATRDVRTFEDVLFNVSHDLRGWFEGGKCFLPRSHNYGDKLKAIKKSEQKQEVKK